MLSFSQLLALLSLLTHCHAYYSVSEALNNFTTCITRFSESKYNVSLGPGDAIYYTPLDRYVLNKTSSDVVFMGCLIAFTRGIDITLVPDLDDVEGDLVHDPAMLNSDYNWDDVLQEHTTEINPYFTEGDISGNRVLDKRDNDYIVMPSDEDKTCDNIDMIHCDQSTCYSVNSPYKSVKAGVDGCSYIQFETWSHHRCSGRSSALKAAWIMTDSSCIGKTTYSWEGDCSNNPCYGYLLKMLACPNVGSVDIYNPW